MLKKPLFLETFILLAVVGMLNYAAVRFHLYWSVNEFDSLVHFLGGATISLFFSWLYFYSGFFNPASRQLKNFLVVSLLGAMLVSVLWEIFELFLGEASIDTAHYSFDTTLDFIMDFLGALGACLYGFLKETKSETRNMPPTIGETKFKANQDNSDV